MTDFELFLIGGIGLVAIELFIFSLSTIWLFITGIAAILTAIFIFIYPDSNYNYQFFAGAMLVCSILLYYPLRRVNNKNKVPGNTTIGDTAQALTYIDKNSGFVSYSGSKYKARTNNELINQGEFVKIKALEGITLIVEKS